MSNMDYLVAGGICFGVGLLWAISMSLEKMAKNSAATASSMSEIAEKVRFIREDIHALRAKGERP